MSAPKTPLGGHAPVRSSTGGGGSEREAATVPPRGSMEDIRLNGSEVLRAAAEAQEAYENAHGAGSWLLLEPVDQRGLIAAQIKAARS